MDVTTTRNITRDMDMLNNAQRSTCRLALLVGPALAGIFWSIAVLPAFLEAAPTQDVAAHIVADDRFKSGVLQDAVAAMEVQSGITLLQPKLLRARALARLRLAEQAMADSNIEKADSMAVKAQGDLKAALASTPSDPFLWLMLYSITSEYDGLGPEALLYLDRSYVVGPTEGWIALRRNRLALKVFPFLREITQSAVTLEFAEMVDSGFIEDAADNLTSVGWPQRERLVASLATVDIKPKQALATRLSAAAFRLTIPGVEQLDRPWLR